MTDYREPRLEHLYDMHVDLDPPQVIGAASKGRASKGRSFPAAATGR